MPSDSDSRAYARFPAIHEDTVVFISEDDLWQVSAAGGIAQRLTAGQAPVNRPLFTADGRSILVISQEEGESDVYRMPSGGGPLKRLTYTGGVVNIAGRLADGRVAAAINAKLPFPRVAELHAITVDGSPADMEHLPWGPALQVSAAPDGRGLVLGRKTADLATWKRYRGGTTGELWIDAASTGRFTLYQAPQHGNLTSPMWIQDRIYFLSDWEGIGNLYSIQPDGQDLRRHTDHDTYYARGASTDGRRIVYFMAGVLYVFDPASDENRALQVRVPSPRSGRARKYVGAAEYVNEYAPHPTAEEVLLVARGQLFRAGFYEGPVDEWSGGSGVRVKHAHYVGDGAAVLAVDDAGGEERLVRFTPDAAGGSCETTVVTDADLGQMLHVAPNPAGTLVAVTNHRQELYLVTVATGHATRVEANPYGRIGEPAWSPHGRYVAYACPDTPESTGLKILDTADGTTYRVTDPVVADVAPAWDPDGRYLFFLGSRRLNPVYDQITFDMGFPRAIKPYLVTLQRDVTSPFVGLPPTKASAKGQRDASAEPEQASGSEEPEATVATDADPAIDFEGITERVVPFPVAEGLYRHIVSLGLRVLWLSFPVRGQLSSDLFDVTPTADGQLECYDLAERRQETLVRGVSDFRLSGDRKTILYRAGRKLSAIEAGKKAADHEHEREGRKAASFDWGRVPVLVDPPAEWAQMLREAWRMMRNRFWSADMAGVDWDAMYTRYHALLPLVGTRSELSDVIWEMQAELGTSHAYERGGDYREPPRYHHGFLGADFRWDAAHAGWAVTHIVRGDSSVEGQDSPLRSPGVDAAVGDVLVAIDGRRASPELTPEHLLMRRRQKEVRLTLRRPPGDQERTVVVRTLASEHLARYREWVEQNRRLVHDKTAGRVGYLHIPDMMAWGFSEFYRLFQVEVLHEGLIVDVRFNSGGHVSQLLLEKLNRRVIGYDYPRWGAPQSYPQNAPRGPVVAVTNDWAGSDGDIFSHSFKLMGLGPLVGRRTWGGVIGINVANPLVDGTIVTQPEFSFWFKDVGWGVENYGTDPTIPVDYAPQDYAAHEDPQLRRAIEEAERLLAAAPAAAPPDDPRPSRRVPPLPPRPQS